MALESLKLDLCSNTVFTGINAAMFITFFVTDMQSL